MANAALGQIYQVTFRGLLHNQVTMSTFYFRIDNLPNVLTVEQVYTELEGFINTAGDLSSLYRTLCPTNWTMDEHWIQCIHPQRFRKATFPINLPGTSTLSSTTSNNSLSITRAGEIAARNRVGGIRVPIAPTGVVGGLITTGLFNAAVTLANQMKLGYGGGAGTLYSQGFISMVPGQTPGVKIPDFTITFTAFPQETARVMRRRTVGLGI